jgi:hypothetical protein
MSRKDMVWVQVKTPKKISQWEKDSLMKRIEAEIAKTTKLRQAVSRIEIRAGRVYLYQLYEPTITPGVIFTVPLIDGKYLEFPYARITMYASINNNCSLDWPTSDKKWMTLDEGSLEECIQKAEQSDWFE